MNLLLCCDSQLVAQIHSVLKEILKFSLSLNNLQNLTAHETNVFFGFFLVYFYLNTISSIEEKLGLT